MAGVSQQFGADSGARKALRKAPPARRTYTVTEAAAILGISRAKAYDCVRRGELRSLSFGRRIVVPAAVIDELLTRADGRTGLRRA